MIPLGIPPKTINGTRRNVKWTITYERATPNRPKARWYWHVEVSLTPQVFNGYAETEAAARKEVDALVKSMMV